MMQVDQISYIFGSFSRRRQNKEHRNNASKKMPQPPIISHDRSHSAPHAPQKNNCSSSSALRAKSVCNLGHEVNERFLCPGCDKFYIEPRVLPCLHTFCTKCLQEFEREIWLNATKGNLDQRPSKSIRCPICSSKISLPTEGIKSFPINYLLQHKMVLTTLNAPTTRLLCDLCTGENQASYRCDQCIVNLCEECTETHWRQKAYSSHQILTIEEARKKGITRVRRQIMCQFHPEKELSIFCTSCFEVICRECVFGFHKNHTYESASRAAKSFTNLMRNALAKARFAEVQTKASCAKIQQTSSKIDSRSIEIREEIDRFIENYVQDLEEHRKKLCRQVEQTKQERLDALEKHKNEFEKRLKCTKNAVEFAEELLEDASDVEFLTFFHPVVNKLEQNFKKIDNGKDISVPENLQFLPEEKVENEKNPTCPLFGVVTTQTVSARNCTVHTEGLENLRVGQKTEVLIETKDKDDVRLERGGEKITADLRHRDAGISRSLLVHVEDKRDGTYKVSFTPDVAGKLLLSISIKGHQIKDSPFPFMVRTLRPHHGTFHCCSFCSSGGSKEASCGCGGKMPGGYRGCGHGHEGHPGRRHWSCCGNVIEHSECVRANSSHYQFTL